MPCLQPDSGKGAMPYDMQWLRDLREVSPGGYPLFFSNSPERINTQSLPGNPHQGVLWHYKSPQNITPVRIRMYIWHAHYAKPMTAEDPLPGPAHLGITLRNPMQAGNLVVTESRRRVSPFTATNPLPRGICLAKALLGDTLDPYPINDVPAGSNTLVATHSLADGTGVGAVYDFWVLSDGAAHQFELRTVVSTVEANLTGLLGDPIAPHNGGGRGYWETNQISAEVFPEMAPANPGEHWSITRAGGPDQLFTSDTSFDPANAVTNSGNYGVIYDPITIVLANAMLPAFTVRARLASRNTTEPYGGAMDRGTGVLGVPALEYNPNTGVGEVVFLRDIAVPRGGAATPWSFRLTHAGAAAMPVSVLLSALNP